MSWTTAGAPVIGMGCMRLSTDRDRDEDRAITVLHAAFDAGVTLLDTADAYCWDDTEAGHNERLIARALATWTEDAQVNVAWRTLSSSGTLDAASFGPTVQFRYQRELEPPDPSERFSRIDVMPFERRHEPSFVNRALIV